MNEWVYQLWRSCRCCYFVKSKSMGINHCVTHDASDQIWFKCVSVGQKKKTNIIIIIKLHILFSRVYWRHTYLVCFSMIDIETMQPITYYRFWYTCSHVSLSLISKVHVYYNIHKSIYATTAMYVIPLTYATSCSTPPPPPSQHSLKWKGRYCPSGDYILSNCWNSIIVQLKRFNKLCNQTTVALKIERNKQSSISMVEVGNNIIYECVRADSIFLPI